MAILAVARIGGSYRVTIPKEVREHLQLLENSELIFYSVKDMKGRVFIRHG